MPKSHSSRFAFSTARRKTWGNTILLSPEACALDHSLDHYTLVTLSSYPQLLDLYRLLFSLQTLPTAKEDDASFNPTSRRARSIR